MIEPRLSFTYKASPCPICRICDRQAVVFAATRALFKAGNKIEISNAMMPMTTSSSTSVNPVWRCFMTSFLSDRAGAAE